MAPKLVCSFPSSMASGTFHLALWLVYDNPAGTLVLVFLAHFCTTGTWSWLMVLPSVLLALQPQDHCCSPGSEAS